MRMYVSNRHAPVQIDVYACMKVPGQRIQVSQHLGYVRAAFMHGWMYKAAHSGPCMWMHARYCTKQHIQVTQLLADAVLNHHGIPGNARGQLCGLCGVEPPHFLHQAVPQCVRAHLRTCLAADHAKREYAP